MKTIEKHGMTAVIEIHYDEHMGAPWEEHDGHGVVSDWTTRDKRPGELVLHSYRHSNRYYDFEATTAIAKQDGWGLSEEHIAQLEKKLGRKPTKKQIIAESVRRDYEHLRAWCNDEWHWTGYTVEITRDGSELDADSCWGYDDEAYCLSEAISSAEHMLEKLNQDQIREEREDFTMACADIQTI